MGRLGWGRSGAAVQPAKAAVTALSAAGFSRVGAYQRKW
jgi:hypothetical protein